MNVVMIFALLSLANASSPCQTQAESAVTLALDGMDSSKVTVSPAQDKALAFEAKSERASVKGTMTASCELLTLNVSCDLGELREKAKNVSIFVARQLSHAAGSTEEPTVDDPKLTPEGESTIFTSQAQILDEKRMMTGRLTRTCELTKFEVH